MKDGFLCREADARTYIELPTLDMLSRVLVGNDDDELGYFAAHHPFIELAHDFLDVCLDLVVGRDCAVRG